VNLLSGKLEILESDKFKGALDGTEKLVYNWKIVAISSGEYAIFVMGLGHHRDIFAI